MSDNKNILQTPVSINDANPNLNPEGNQPEGNQGAGQGQFNNNGTQPVEQTTGQENKNEGQGSFKENKPDGNQPKVDYRNKFVNSSRENMILRSRLGELNQKVDEFTKTGVPSDEEMQKMYPDQWEMMDEFQQDTLKREVARDRKLNNLTKTIEDISNSSKREAELYGLVSSDPRLEGKEEEFLEFASKPTRQEVDTDTLLKAFLFDEKPSEAPKSEPQGQGQEPSPKGGGLESGTPSGGEEPQNIGFQKGQELSNEQLEHLRKSNPKTYNEMIRKGEI